MGWLFLPVSVGLNSVSNNSSLNQESFVMSRGKPLAHQSLSRKWKKDSYMRLLYGLMLEPSTAQSLVEKWISLLPDSHVNHLVKLENSKEKKMSDGYGMILKGSLARFDPTSSSWKTFQTSLTGELMPFLGPWPNSGSMLNMVVSKCPKLAETITEIDSSYLLTVPKEGVLWPTPSTIDSGDFPLRKVAKESLKKGGWRGINLNQAVKIYPTPTASQIATEGTTRLYRNLYLNKTLTLEEATIMNFNYNPLQKKGSLEIFPTPTLAESKNVPYQISNGKKYPTLLGHLKIWPTPQASEGEKYRLQGQSQGSKCLMALHGGKLNPQFVEWLMGWPIGWTDLEHVETESFLIKHIGHILNSSKEQSKGGI